MGEERGKKKEGRRKKGKVRGPVVSRGSGGTGWLTDLRETLVSLEPDGCVP